MSRSATQTPAPLTRPASRHCGEQAMQPYGETCQACANASRSTVVAASPRPRWMDGLRANACTTLTTARCPIVTWKPADCFRARASRSVPECGAPMTKTG